MALTKQDLSAIRGVVKEELAVTNKKIDKNFIFLKKRFDELFNFLDRKYLQVKREVRDIQTHLHLPVSEF